MIHPETGEDLSSSKLIFRAAFGFFIDFGLFSLSCPLLLFGLWDGEPLGEQAGEILDETLSRSNVE
jgi:hypothetical protein